MLFDVASGFMGVGCSHHEQARITGRELLKRARAANRFAHFLCGPERCLVGVVNINEVVRGAFDSGYLGFYAFVPHAGRGYMRSGISVVISGAFADYGLHRLEANVQPENIRSRTLVQSLGFRLEGYSPRYLRIAAKWRDHERWAITREDWKEAKRKA
jgi:[ribosomal protein S5]-alanine N-acetyltransferase